MADSLTTKASSPSPLSHAERARRLPFIVIVAHHCDTRLAIVVEIVVVVGQYFVVGQITEPFTHGYLTHGRGVEQFVHRVGFEVVRCGAAGGAAGGWIRGVGGAGGGQVTGDGSGFGDTKVSTKIFRQNQDT